MGYLPMSTRYGARSNDVTAGGAPGGIGTGWCCRCGGLAMEEDEEEEVEEEEDANGEEPPDEEEAVEA